MRMNEHGLIDSDLEMFISWKGMQFVKLDPFAIKSNHKLNPFELYKRGHSTKYLQLRNDTEERNRRTLYQV